MKLVKRWIALILISALAVSFIGCGKKDDGTNNNGTTDNNQGNNQNGGTANDGTNAGTNDEENILVVYTARSEDLNKLVIGEFEKETGIQVELVTAGTGELLKRVESEKDNPLGDVLWAADRTMLESSSHLFMQYVSKEDGNMLEGFQNTTGYFSPAFADPPVLIVNTNLKGNLEIKGFEDLLNPELKGKIAFGDPVNSSSAFQSLVAMLYAMGENNDPMSDKAWDFVDKFLKNLDGKMSNSSSQVYKGVAEGEYVVGLTWEDPAANYVKEGANVEVVFPKEGTIFPGESVQIIKGCKHPENAKKFVDFMLSEDIQNKVGTQLTVRPLRKNAQLADYMTPQSEIKLFSNYDEGWVAANKAEITSKFSEHLESSLD